MKVLITGALGFTARHLVARLRKQGDVMIAGTDLARHEHGLDAFDSYTHADLSDGPAVVELVRRTRPDWIFHLAGMFRGSPTELYRINLFSALHLLEAVQALIPDAAALMVGSAAEYGSWPSSHMPLSEDHACHPVTHYGLSKNAMTRAAQLFAGSAGVKVVVARPFNLVGAGMPASLVAGAVAQRARSALAKGESTIKIGNLEAERDFVAVEDAVDAYVKLLEKGPWGEVVNVCSGQPRSIRSIVETLLSFSPSPIQVVQENALKRSNDPALVVGQAAKARSLFGFTPKVKLDDSLRAAWDATVVPDTSAAVKSAA